MNTPPAVVAAPHKSSSCTFGANDHMRPYPADGTLISSHADGGIYRFAGGAPLWISEL